MTPGGNDQNGRGLFVGRVPWGILLALAAYFVTGMVWGVRLESRVDGLEELSRRIGALEERTQRLVIVEERQRVVLERLSYHQRQIDYLIQMLTPHPGAPKPEQPRMQLQGDGIPPP